MSAIGFKYRQSEKSRKPFAENGEAQALSSGCHDAAVAYGINPQGGGMNPFDEELGETQSVCHQGGVMQVQCYDGYNQMTHKEVSMTIRRACSGGESNDATPKVAIGFKAWQSADGGLGDEREVSPTLSHKPSALEPTVCCNSPQAHSTTRGFGVDVAPTMGAAAGDSGNNKPFISQSQCDLSQMRYIVRRLTPTEAERLMGLPDGYTIPVGLRKCFADGAPSPSLIAEFQRIHDAFNTIMYEYALAAYKRSHREGEPPQKPPKPKSASQVRTWLEKITDPDTCPDSPRYKACGNGWATNQPRWILTRLLAIGEHIDTFTGEEDAPCS